MIKWSCRPHENIRTPGVWIFSQRDTVRGRRIFIFQRRVYKAAKTLYFPPAVCLTRGIRKKPHSKNSIAYKFIHTPCSTWSVDKLARAVIPFRFSNAVLRRPHNFVLLHVFVLRQKCRRAARRKSSKSIRLVITAHRRSSASFRIIVISQNKTYTDKKHEESVWNSFLPILFTYPA